MAGAMQWQHWVLILVIVLLLFGSTRLPGLAKSVGQSMKIFRKEIKDLRDDKPDAAADNADGRTDGNAADNAPGASTRSAAGSTTSADPVPGLITNKDRDIPKA